VQFFTGLDLTKYIVIPGLYTAPGYANVQAFQGLLRPSATAIDPLELAAVLAMILPFAIHQARYAPSKARWWRWLQVGLISLGLLMTVSRTAVIGIVIVLAVLMPTWSRRERGRAYLVIIASVAATRAFVPGLIGTLRNLILATGSDTDTASRTSGLSAAGGFIAQHPWFGRGFGTFLPQTYRFLDDQYLGSLVETGIVGLLAILALFATGWSLARRARRASQIDEYRHLAQSLAASVAVAAVTFATFDALGFPMATGIAFLMLGCAGALWRLMSRVKTQPVESRENLAADYLPPI
jgi:O-antigen ligase